ncbi:MAG TPA: Panacea domain-containing protein [Gaiellaceae bacterium]
MAGGREFERGKFEELIVYLAHQLGPEAALGRVKLAKLLMHSDFTAFQRLGVSITGATYEKWEFGHLPKELLLAERDLQADGSIEEEDVDHYGRRLRHVTAKRDPVMADFSEDEIAIIEGAIRTYGHESASYLSQLSHADPGWYLSKENAPIPYETALISRRVPTDAEVEFFRRLHGLAA